MTRIKAILLRRVSEQEAFLVLLLVLANTLDYLFTCYLLHHEVGFEGNQILASIGPVEMGLIKAAMLLPLIGICLLRGSIRALKVVVTVVFLMAAWNACLIILYHILIEGGTV